MSRRAVGRGSVWQRYVRGVVMTETCSAAAYAHVGLAFGHQRGERRQEDRLLRSEQIFAIGGWEGRRPAASVTEAVGDAYGFRRSRKIVLTPSWVWLA